jgi:hypothetical protein
VLGENWRLYDCDHCAENPYYLTMLGHDGPPQGMWLENLGDGTELKRCPRRDLLEADSEVLAELRQNRVELYPLYRQGHLARAGGVLDQDARYIALMRAFDSMTEAVQRKFDAIKHESEAQP